VLLEVPALERDCSYGAPFEQDATKERKEMIAIGMIAIGTNR
jgi:hypothetical protein